MKSLDFSDKLYKIICQNKIYYGWDKNRFNFTAYNQLNTIYVLILDTNLHIETFWVFSEPEKSS